MSKYTNEEWLRHEIESENKSRVEVAENEGVSHKTVMKYSKRYNVGDDLQECPNCEEVSPQLGKHWNGSKCEHPKMSQYQQEVIVGILMGDGSINAPQGNQNARFRIDMYEKSVPYLEYLSEKVFPVVTTEVRAGETAEERSQRKTNPFGIDSENASDMFYLSSRRMPCLNKFLSWYVDGNKTWPCGEIELTPTVLKHYFVGDGNYNTNGNADYIELSMSNQLENMENVISMFESAGFEPKNVKERSRDGKNAIDVVVSFDKQTTQKMFEYMGEPLPSFEYKWPNDYDYDYE